MSTATKFPAGAAESPASAWGGNLKLKETDPELVDIIAQEKDRQHRGLELVASEVGTLKVSF